MERQKLRSLALRETQAYSFGVERKRQAVESLTKLLSSLGHHSVLARGFAIVRNEVGHMVRGVAEARQSGMLDIEFTDGHVSAVTRKDGDRPGQEPPSDAPLKAPRTGKAIPPKGPPKGGSRGSNQGSLF